MSASRLVRALVTFELVRRVKMISTWVYAVILFAAGFFMMLSAGGAFSSVTVVTSNERVMANSPQSLFSTIGIVGLFGVFTVAAIFGQAAHQDFQHDTWMLIFTKNVRKTPYLVGRFLAALVFACMLFLAVGVGRAPRLLRRALHPSGGARPHVGGGVPVALRRPGYGRCSSSSERCSSRSRRSCGAWPPSTWARWSSCSGTC